MSTPSEAHIVFADDTTAASRFLNHRRALEEVLQADLADVVGTTQSAISDFFACTKSARFDTVSKLANALGYRLAFVPFTADDHYLAEKASEL